MRIFGITMVGVGILSAALAFESAQAGQSAQADGQCQLINTQQGRDLYSGDCTITETVKNNGQMTVWDIRMGSAESFLFACQPNGDCMHGPDEVTFKDHGNSASFRWSNFRLEVQQEMGAPSSAQRTGTRKPVERGFGCRRECLHVCGQQELRWPGQASGRGQFRVLPGKLRSHHQRRRRTLALPGIERRYRAGA